jgi:CheY-like chemotaxis protein
MAANASILVVDNEIDHLEIMKETLRRIGYDAWTTDSPQQALDWVADHPFRLVIMDLIMPDVDGTDLCEQIKQIRPAISIFAFSGHAHLYGQERLERIGFDGTIGKPSTMEEIRTAVSQVMEDQPVPGKK